MLWISDVEKKIKAKNQILVVKDSELLRGLAEQINKSSRHAVILWALGLAEETVNVLEKRYPDEKRPRNALIAAQLWSEGKIKMRQAQRAILDCHAVAKEIIDPADIALCHAVGQACAVVHTEGHALGYPIYELTAVIGSEISAGGNYVTAAEKRVGEYIDRLKYYAEMPEDESRDWAEFLKQ